MATTAYQFRHCTVQITEHQQARHVATIFTDGTKTTAIPNDDPESRARARSLGYGQHPEAVWQMTRWHDLLHTVIAEAEGHPWSPTLHAVAHGYDLAPGVAQLEERRVLLVQHLLNDPDGALPKAQL